MPSVVYASLYVTYRREAERACAFVPTSSSAPSQARLGDSRLLGRWPESGGQPLVEALNDVVVVIYVDDERRRLRPSHDAV